MRRRATLGFILGALAGAAAPAGAAVLINVDVSTPAAVTLTATTNASQINDSSASLYDGVTLAGFFTVPFSDTIGFAYSGNVKPPSAISASYNNVGTDLWPFTTGFCLFYDGVSSTSTLQTFTTAVPAFSGMGTANISLYASRLPVPGASGNIVAGYSGAGSNAVIGQWVAVVPEPSMAIFGGAGAAMFLLRRRNAV